MNIKLAQKLFNKNIVSRGRFSIDKTLVNHFIFELLDIFYPQLSKKRVKTEDDLILLIKKSELALYELLVNVLSPEEASKVVEQFIESLGAISDLLDLDAVAIFDGDPAAKNIEEVISCYPGFMAIFVHRISHCLYSKKVPIIPRILSEQVHQLTGIDIHPGATIGKHFVIDHGTGIVIGETTLIGNHVKIYQGVTLGALSVDKKNTKKKRHPTIEDKCTIYSNATILGGKTVIGQSSVVGGNVWITHSVPQNSVVYHTSQIKVSPHTSQEESGEIS